MITPKRLFVITVVTSILFGIILPLALDIKNTELIAVIFSAFWSIYAVLLLVTLFLVKSGLRIKVSRQNGVTMVRYELRKERVKDCMRKKGSC